MISAEYTPDPGDYTAFIELLVRRSALARYAPLAFAGLVAGVAVVAAAMTSWPGNARWPILVAGVFGLALGWLSHMAAGKLLKPARLQAAMLFRNVQRQGFIVPQRMELTPEGLRTSSPNGETLTRWCAVKDVVQTDTHLFIFISRTIAFIIPRRAFQDGDSFKTIAQQAVFLHQTRISQ